MMSQENIKKAQVYARFLGIRYYDIAEQIYNGQAETVLIIYIDKEHTQELEHHIYKD